MKKHLTTVQTSYLTAIKRNPWQFFKRVPVLTTLENRGLIEWEMESEHYPVPHLMYRITDAGLTALEETWIAREQL